jgi:hypothetical protein
MESRILELRDRSRRNLARFRRSALIALAVGAALGVAVTGVYVTYRLTRRPSRRERLQRLLPSSLTGWSGRLARTRRRGLRHLGHGLPPIRLSVGERETAQGEHGARAARILFRAAAIAGRAAGTAMATRLLATLAERGRERRG